MVASQQQDLLTMTLRGYGDNDEYGAMNFSIDTSFRHLLLIADGLLASISAPPHALLHDVLHVSAPVAFRLLEHYS